MAQEEKQKNKPHNIILEDRKTMSISGVQEVISFDDSFVDLQTSLGRLNIKGEELVISNLNTAFGDVSLSGHINSIVYTQSGAKNTSLLAKLFR